MTACWSVTTCRALPTVPTCTGGLHDKCYLAPRLCSGSTLHSRFQLAFCSEMRPAVHDRSRSPHHKSSDLFIMRVSPKPHSRVCRVTSPGKVSNHSLLPGAWSQVACWSVHCFWIMNPTPPIDTDLHDGNASGHPSCPARVPAPSIVLWASMVANTTQAG